MITALDTNILIDILAGDPEFGPISLHAYRRCLQEGSTIASDVVWAEVAASFPTAKAARDALDRLQLSYRPVDERAALMAGQRWREYRQSGGGRARIVSDFLIGAHARVEADRLLTRDRGFYRSYFEDLMLLDPARA